MFNKQRGCSIQSELLVTSSYHLYAGSIVFASAADEVKE